MFSEARRAGIILTQQKTTKRDCSTKQNKNQPTNMTTYNDLSDTSRVWVYQADRNFTEKEEQEINQQISIFVVEWAAHGAALKAYGRVYHNRFVALFVDQSQASASGCSIDSSVKLIRMLEEKYKVDFFDRMSVTYIDEENQIKSFKIKDVNACLETGAINLETKVFNNLVDTKAKFESEWMQSLKDTWLATKIKVS